MIENEEENFVTDEWKLYEKGKSYNMSVGLYEDTEKNHNFYHGKQWGKARVGNIKTITLNFIKNVVKTKVGRLNSYLYQIVFNPNTYENYEEQQKLEELCKSLNRYCNKMWEQSQVQSRALFVSIAPYIVTTQILSHKSSWIITTALSKLSATEILPTPSLPTTVATVASVVIINRGVAIATPLLCYRPRLLRCIRAVDRLDLVVEVAIVKHIDIKVLTTRQYAKYLNL